MEPNEALQVVASACARMQGTLAEHQRIQEALSVVASVVREPELEEVSADGSS